MLPVESKTALIFQRRDPLDRRQVSIAESVILGSEQTFPAFKDRLGSTQSSITRRLMKAVTSLEPSQP